MKIVLVLILLSVVYLALYYYRHSLRTHCSTQRPNIQTIPDIIALFPSTVAGVKKQVDQALAQAKSCLESLYAVPHEQRTFKNTMLPLDVMEERFGIARQALYVVSSVSPDDEVRKASHDASGVLSDFAVDNFLTNVRLYEACASYEKRLEDPVFAAQESLTDEQKLYVKETMRDFRRYGLQLSADKRKRVVEIQKELALFDTSFEQVVASANKSIEVSKEELDGLSDSFIAHLKKTGEDRYLVPVEGPNYDEIMQNCTITETRKRIYREYMQRGYPTNEKALATIIRLRDELAGLLGFASYAHFDLDTAMAKNPENVERFLSSLIERARAKCSLEMDLLKKELPENVFLTETGQFFPWDVGYVRNQYKKKHLALDEAEIANYFPIDYTLPALLGVYEKFFGLTFKRESASGFWHKGVELLLVSKEGAYLGAIVLDLYPRQHKYTHAGVASVVPSLKLSDGTICPAVAVMMANFPPARDGRPALLKHYDVVVFFHEFGHALHCLLGTTTLARFAALDVKRDFVEMPSQMLESWLYDAEVLKLISRHYETKKPLPDELIQKIKEQKNFGVGDHVLRQLIYAYMSLNCFLPGPDKDAAALWKELHESLRDHVFFDPENRGYCDFTHLVGYGAGYYGYLWSQVYAIDLAHYIEQYGFLDKTVGERYTAQILGKGASEEPASMLKTFLGREPNSDAFFKELGL